MFQSYFQSKNTNSENKSILNEKYFVDEKEEELFNILNDIIDIEINKETRFVELSVEIQNPIYSSIIANRSLLILQDYLINYKIISAKNLLNFTKKNYDIKKLEFEKIQNELAKFKDENQAISSSLFSNRLFILQNKFDLEKTLFQELAKQFEQAKIKVKKDTPLFVVLKNAEVPNKKHSPKRTRLIILFFFFGLFSSISYVISIDYLKAFINKIIK